ncbi:FAD-dependent oxidoreductase [Kineosporia sp. J2-2]|uniref:FAD-dependent oxidoreductase n=1 Tax=Kineosporia corallincola TaxID=2835133 RepID=A0ABS5TFH0_9ACTN|nr:FAD-dependent oxidoreductase [Kineosporia corallincola]MBT0768838.1 FAD-dependent oxidoreductase [Kineosporia corallincola]
MKRREVHVVIGGGVAGCISAIMRSRAGYEVILCEQQEARSTLTHPICTETSNIVSENHSGAEYPFDPRSARDCLDGRIVNERFFPEFIYGGKTYSRIIASQSMMDDGHDIVAQCRSNMKVLESHYAQRCAEDEANAVFGDPAAICREIPTVEGVNDVASAFLTPQRGMNPVLVATVLEWELRQASVDFRAGTRVTSVTTRSDGRYEVTADSAGSRQVIVADQISLCCGTAAFAVAKRLNPAVAFPRLFMALREILYVDLPEGTDKNFTCLKLEDAYGGMLSPLSPAVAMIYHPPAAHVMNEVMHPETGAPPSAYREYLSSGHPEAPARAARTLERLREFYPELARSQILGTYLKIAINTVSDSRVRRNIGVFDLGPGASMTVLPKWTMCAVNARTELGLALRRSADRGHLSPGEVPEVLAQGSRPCWDETPSWARDPATALARSTEHARAMKVPELLAHGFPPGFAGSAAARVGDPARVGGPGPAWPGAAESGHDHGDA